MAGRFLVAAALCPLAFAFSDTFPLVAWSSHGSSVLDILPSALSNIAHSSALLENILLNDDVCGHDAVVLIDQPGLHASDLRTLSPSSKLARSLSSSPSARQFPYVPNHPDTDIASFAEFVSSRCNSNLVNFAPGQGGVSLDRSEKHVVSLNMPYLESSGKARKTAMNEHESLLSAELDVLASLFPNHLIIYTGSPSPASLNKRQSPDTASPTRPVLDLNTPALSGPTVYANTTLPEGGILKRYQLLTPGLITVLLVTFFLLVPVVMIGISALASIQSPLRVGPPKGFSATEKKTQ